jgi:hypothetical protein
VHPCPVFVLGHPKSGTTAIAALLAKTSGEDFTDDLFQQANLARTAKEALFSEAGAFAGFVNRHPQLFATRINKSPKLTFFYDDLRALFPAARYVYVVRDPRSTLRSFLGWRRIPGNLETVDDPAQRRQLEVLPAQQPGHYVDRLAHRWNTAADVYLHHREKMTLVRYEDFASWPVDVVQRLARTVGLSSAVDISAETAVRYKSSGAADTAWRDFFGATNLTRIETICGERMRAFGYAWRGAPRPQAWRPLLLQRARHRRHGP